MIQVEYVFVENVQHRYSIKYTVCCFHYFNLYVNWSDEWVGGF